MTLHNITHVLKVIAANPESIILAIIVLAVILGKGRAVLSVLAQVSEIIDCAQKMGAVSPSSVAAQIAQATRLTEEHAKTILSEEDSGKLAVNKVALATTILTSGDGRKIQRKVRKWLSKL